MPQLCTYFMNGSCRFGSKCVNDHIDLKTLLKNEAEAVLNGEQWLLSCFGPFKESVSFANFIEDRSFEEIRLGYLESGKNGNIQNYINNLMNEYNNAVRKMNELKMASNDTLQIVASIYNSSTTDQKKTAVTPVQPQVQNPFQTSNIQPQQQQSMMSTASIFGGSSSSNPFQQQSTIQQPNSGTGNTAPFSFSLTQSSQPKPSIFSQSNSIFGSSSQPQSSVFGNSSNVFGQSGTNAFSMTNAPQTTSIFASSIQPQMTNQSQSIFQPTANQSNIFGGSVQSVPPTVPNQQNIFGGSVQSVPPTVPNQQNVFSSFPQNRTFPQTTNSMFSGTQTAPATQQNVFQQQQPTGTNVFSQFQTNTNQMSQPQETQQMQSNFFNTNQPVEMQQAQMHNPNQMSVPAQSSVFGGNPFQNTSAISDEHFYSKPEDLSPENIQEFQAECFTFGKIPLVPPTKSLVFG